MEKDSIAFWIMLIIAIISESMFSHFFQTEPYSWGEIGMRALVFIITSVLLVTIYILLFKRRE